MKEKQKKVMLGISLCNEGCVWRLNMHSENLEPVINLWSEHSLALRRDNAMMVWVPTQSSNFYGVNFTIYDRKEANKILLAFINSLKSLKNFDVNFKSWQAIK